MELEEIRGSPGRFSHSHHDFAGEEEDAQLLELIEVHRDDHSLNSPIVVQPMQVHQDHYAMQVRQAPYAMNDPVVVQPLAVHRDHFSMNSPVGNMMDYHRHHQPTTTTTTTATTSQTHEPPSYQWRPSGGSRNGHQWLASSESHPWARSRSVSSLSDGSCGSDSETAKSSAKSSPSGSDCSMTNSDSGACSGRAAASGAMGGPDKMAAGVRAEERSRVSFSPAKELREVFSWVDENNDGLICGADLRGFMSRVLAFEISASEAEALLLSYSNGRTLRTGAGAVVDFEGFLALYQCLCGEQVSPEEQSMMAAASRVFDKTRLQSDRWA